MNWFKHILFRKLLLVCTTCIVMISTHKDTNGSHMLKVELHWLEHLWDYENVFETGVIGANEGLL